MESKLRESLNIRGSPGVIATHFTPHGFRHTRTSLLLEADVPLHEIMNRLRHADNETTRNVYFHVTKYKKKSASQKFAQLLKDAVP